jgi:anti-sigma B factor antagonist
MFSVDFSTSERGPGIVVTLRGELDLAGAAGVAAALAAVAARKPEIVVDLGGLEFIDSSGVAALAHGRKHARRAGGDLLLAAPQQQVLRVLTLTRLVDALPVHTSVSEAAGRAGLSRLVAAPTAGGSAGMLAGFFHRGLSVLVRPVRRMSRPRSSSAAPS